MSSLQIYTWIAVPCLAVLIGIKILLDVLRFKALKARFDRFDAWRDRVDLQLQQRPDKRLKLDIR